MTGPEANHQYDLWVDRCREQLARGAAGDTLAAWMQAEGMSAEMAASVVQTALGGLSAGSGQARHEHSMAPAPRSEEVRPAAIAAAVPARGTPTRDATTGAIAGSFDRSAGVAGGDPLPATAGSAQIVAGAATAYPKPATPPPSTLFGTPRPPVTFSPVTRPADLPSQEQPARSTEESAAAPATGDERVQDIDARPDGAPDEQPSGAPTRAAPEPAPESSTDTGHRLADDSPADEAHDDETRRPGDAAPEDPDSAMEGMDQSGDRDPGGFAEIEADSPYDTDTDEVEHPEPGGSPAEEPARDLSQRVPERDDEGPHVLAHDGPHHLDEAPREDAPGKEMNLQDVGREAPAGSLDDPVEGEPRDEPERSAGPVDEAPPGATGASAIEPDAEVDPAATMPARKRGFGRRSSTETPAPIADVEDDPALAAGNMDRMDSNAEMADGRQSELSRIIRDAEGEGGQDTDVPPRLPDPQTDEELAAAAKKLGISFRDDPQMDRPLAPPVEDDELSRAARELGISFRDEPDAPALTDPDDPTAKAARQLGISFRDLDPPKPKQKGTLRRYWPIILVMALAAVGMPAAAIWMMLSWA